jgi:hypothetical protein
MVPVERPKTNEKFASREKILKWKTGLKERSDWLLRELIFRKVEQFSLGKIILSTYANTSFLALPVPCVPGRTRAAERPWGRG